MEERDLAVRAGTGLGVNQLDAFLSQVAQVLADVGGLEAEVVQSFATAFDEARNGVVCLSRLQELDEGVAGLHEGDFESVLGQVHAVDKLEAELVAVEAHCLVDAAYRNADVMDGGRRGGW